MDFPLLKWSNFELGAPPTWEAASARWPTAVMRPGVKTERFWPRVAVRLIQGAPVR